MVWPYCAAHSASFWPAVPVLAIVLSNGNVPEPPITIGEVQSSFVGGSETLSVNVPVPVPPDAKAPSCSM